ncbi:hypothetical protein ARTHRO9AX_180619 [Arthrobacter sp. 9AX]|nr:hypothetical protein ARTHRO9AX_180619 [Arthrobacter sp. 9AX]
MDRSFNNLDATGLGAALRLTDLGVLGDAVDAFNQHAVGLGEHAQDLALLAAVAAALSLGASDDLNEVTLLDLSHGLEHLRSQRNDLHELLVTQFTTNRSEDTGTAGVTVALQDYSCVLVKLDVGTIRTAAFLLGTDDDCLDNIALLYVAARDCILDGGDNDVTDACVATTGSTENANGKDFLSTRVVGDLEPRLLLNHYLLLASRRFSDRKSSYGMSLAERLIGVSLDLPGFCQTRPKRPCQKQLLPSGPGLLLGARGHYAVARLFTSLMTARERRHTNSKS